MGIEAFRYDGKTALVIGGATGMGAATAQVVSELGGSVTVMDVADVRFPVKRAVRRSRLLVQPRRERNQRHLLPRRSRTDLLRHLRNVREGVRELKPAPEIATGLDHQRLEDP
jgi:NAD(P)-dependent dehydrogenase (short-subunit alcohol dehydrogenase family)